MKKDILIAVKNILNKKSNAVIAIDGRCASGKTTLASELSELFDAQVIHMDDFFLPYDMRSVERLSQAGGNIHYERFIDEIAMKINTSEAFEYRIFSCREGGFIGTKSIDTDRPIIIEGAYSLHPEIPDIYDLKIFVNISSEPQLERIRKRNGIDALEAFITKWIPFENRYFEAFNIRDKCDIILNNE